jgi:hypothetical protein
MNALEKFADYVYRFYGPGGIYDMGVTKNEIKLATEIRKLRHPEFEFDGDTIDRELVRDILTRVLGCPFAHMTNRSIGEIADEILTGGTQTPRMSKSGSGKTGIIFSII